MAEIIVGREHLHPRAAIADDSPLPRRDDRWARLGEHQADAEHAALADGAFDRDLTAHDLGQELGNGKAEAGPGYTERTRRLAALKRLEDAREIAGVDADAGIGDFELGNLSAMPR